MMEKLGLFMGHFFEYGHDEFKLILRHGDRLRNFGVLALCFRTSSRTSACSRYSTLGTGTFTPGFLVVLIEPLLISFIHIVDEAIG